MVITILAIVLGVIMTIGGVVPNVANGMLQTKLSESLNHPEYLRVQAHPAAPSFSLLSGTIAYTEIDARNFVVSDFPVEELNLRIDHLSADTSGKQIVLREPTQGMVHVKVTETGLNRFLQSDTFRAMVDEMFKRNEVLSQLGVELGNLGLELQSNKVLIRGQATSMGGFLTFPFALEGQMHLANDRQLIIDNVKAVSLDQPIPQDLVDSIVKVFTPALDLTKLSTDDMQLHFRQLSVHDDYLDLIGEAELKQIPQ